MISALITILILLLVLGVIHVAASYFFGHPVLTILDLILGLILVLAVLRTFGLLNTGSAVVL